MQCNVLVFSHAYLDAENQKNLISLSRHLNVHAVLPNRVPSHLFGGFSYMPHPEARSLVSAFPAVRLLRGQFFLLSLSLGVRGFRPDVILVDYSPWSAMFVQAWLYKCLLFPKARMVCFIKKNTYLESRSALRKVRVWFEKFWVSRVYHFIGASEMAAAMLRRRFELQSNKVSVCHHLGVDTDRFSPRLAGSEVTGQAHGNTIVVGYCGRFDEDKGVLDLVEAVGQARARSGRNIVLALLGHGPLLPKLKQRCTGLPWLQIHQSVLNSKVPEFLHGLDIFVFPSKAMPDHEEHDAHALLEAMSCGLPCIATDVGINPEILKYNCGRLITRDDEDSLIRAIEDLAIDVDVRRRLGHNAREVALREFSLDAVARSKATLLDRVSRE